MKIFGIQQLFLCIIFISVAISSTKGDKTSCTLARIEGTNAGRLTCTFTEDIGQSKHNFNVLRYDLDPTDVVPETVFACYWPKTGGLKCSVNPHGYKLIGNITNQVILEIPDFGKEHEGRYSCQITSGHADSSGQCHYIYHERERGTGGSAADQQSTGLVIAVSVVGAILFIAILTIVIGIYLIRKRNCRRGTNDRDVEHGQQMMPMKNDAERNGSPFQQ